jgi:hypothetical protein
MRRFAWLVLALLAAEPAAAAPGVDGGADKATPAAPQFALQPCAWPRRYDECLDKCDWKKRQYEQSGNCYISLDSAAGSTCRDIEVRVVRACVTRCNADYCPQFRP